MNKTFELPVALRHVQVIYVLNDGKLLIDLTAKELNEKYAGLFRVDRQFIVDEIMRLRPLTSSWNKSVLYITQSGTTFAKIDVPEEWNDYYDYKRNWCEHLWVMRWRNSANTQSKRKKKEMDRRVDNNAIVTDNNVIGGAVHIINTWNYLNHVIWSTRPQEEHF